MNITYITTAPPEIVKTFNEIPYGALFSARAQEQLSSKRHTWLRSYYTVTCLDELGCTYSAPVDGNLKFYGYKQHHDHELIIRD